MGNLVKSPDLSLDVHPDPIPHSGFFCPLELVIEERIWHFINEVIEHFTSTFMIAYRRQLFTRILEPFLD